MGKMVAMQWRFQHHFANPNCESTQSKRESTCKYIERIGYGCYKSEVAAMDAQHSMLAGVKGGR